MPTPRVARARALVEQLADAGLSATCDVREVLGKAPCVLVQPPSLDYDLHTGATATWRLVAVSAVALGNLDAWVQLDELLDELAGVLPLTSAEPTAYKLPTGGDPYPAYIATYTEAVEDQ